jgi:hypothetical protein
MRTSLIDPSDVARNTMLESRLTRRGIGPQVAMGIGRGRETSTTTGKGRMAGSVEVDRNRGPVDRSGSTSAALSVGEANPARMECGPDLWRRTSRARGTGGRLGVDPPRSRPPEAACGQKLVM